MNEVRMSPPALRDAGSGNRNDGLSTIIVADDTYQTVLNANQSRVSWNVFNKSENPMYLRGFCGDSCEMIIPANSGLQEEIKRCNVALGPLEIKGTAGDEFMIYEDCC